jgi:plasmid stability protein
MEPALWFYGMKTTLELPDELMRAVKIRAAERNQRLKDVVADALRAALAAPAAAPVDALDPVQQLARRFVFLPDGTVENPQAWADPAYFSALDALRTESRREPLPNPFESG